ncbi:MAG: hypothetical protein WCH39_19760 [Schlesneria sp.]
MNGVGVFLAVFDISAIATIIGTCAAVLPGGFWLYRHWSTGKYGERKLTKIYRDAIPKSSTFCDERIKGLLDDNVFVRDKLLPPTVSLKEVREAFRTKLHGTAEAHEIDSVLNLYFDQIIVGLAHSDYGPWKQKAQDWTQETKRSSTPVSVPNRRPVFLVLGLLTSKAQLHQRAATAKENFHFNRLGDDSLLLSGDGIQTDANAWRSLIVEGWKKICEAEADEQQVHLVLGTVTLWNLAFGIQLNNKHPSHVLYHVQESFQPVWTINRDIKNRRSPGGSVLPDQLKVEIECEDVNSESEAIVFAIGANPGIVLDVRAYLDATSRQMPIRVVTKKATSLSPDQPDLWVQYAAEMANLINVSRAKERFIFADAPAVLMLMVGDSLGPYNANLHLMQFQNTTDPASKYVEVLCLPDKALDAMIEAGASA